MAKPGLRPSICRLGQAHIGFLPVRPAPLDPKAPRISGQRQVHERPGRGRSSRLPRGCASPHDVDLPLTPWLMSLWPRQGRPEGYASGPSQLRGLPRRASSAEDPRRVNLQNLSGQTYPTRGPTRHQVPYSLRQLGSGPRFRITLAAGRLSVMGSLRDKPRLLGTAAAVGPGCLLPSLARREAG